MVKVVEDRLHKIVQMVIESNLEEMIIRLLTDKNHRNQICEAI